MDVTFHTLEGCTREVELTVSAEELQPKLDEAIKEFQPTVAIKGFRKGKVPLRMVEKMFGEAVEHDMLQKLAEEEFKKIVEEKALAPIGTPALSAIDHTHGGSATLKIRYEVKPEFTLADHHGLKIAKPAHSVSDEEVNAEIDRQRYLESNSTPAEEITGDDFIATLDAQKLDPETKSAIVGAMQRDMKVYLKRGTLQPEIRAGLHNKKVGDTFTVETTENEAAPQLLSITVKAIEHVELPPLDNEFVTRISDGKATTPDEYRALVRTEMQKQWNERNSRSVRDRLAEEYVKLHDFPVPEALVNELLKNFLEEYSRQGVPRNFDPMEFYTQMRPSAEWQARWALVREEFMKQHKIDVEDADVEKFVEDDHARLGVDRERLRQFYKTSDQVREKILLDKVFALLESGAEMTEG